MPRYSVLGAIGAAVVLAGCGGSSSGPGDQSPSSPTTSPTTSADAALSQTAHDALAARLAAAPKLPSEDAPSSAKYQSAGLIAQQDPTNAAALASEGLEGLAFEHLHVSGTTDGIRSVFVFATADGAQRHLHETGAPTGATTFNVPGIPGALGTENPTPGGAVAGRNVNFVAGNYEYVLGVAPNAHGGGPSDKTLAAVATAWYAKVQSLS